MHTPAAEAPAPQPAWRALLQAQGAAPSHGPRLEALQQLCAQTPACLGLALVGSFAQGRGDRLSDLDLAAFVKAGEEGAFLGRAQAVLQGEAVLHQYSMQRPGEVAFSKVIYLDASSCEFHAFSESARFKLRPPYWALWNPGGYLETRVALEPPPRHEDFTPYPHGDAGLVWELYDCIKWLHRGRTALAKGYLLKLASALEIDTSHGASHDATDPTKPG